MPVDELNNSIIIGEDRTPLDTVERNRKRQINDRLQVNNRATVDKQPDQFAKVINLSKKFDLAPSVVEAHFSQLSRTDALTTKQYDKLIDKNPGLARHLSDTDNFAISKDDVESLENLSDSYHSLFEKKKERGLLQVPGTTWDSLTLGMFGVLEGSYMLAHSLDIAGDNFKTDSRLLNFWKKIDVLPNTQTLEVIAKIRQRADAIREQQPDFIQEFNKELGVEGKDVTDQFSRFVTEAPNKLWNGQIIDALKLYGEAGALTVGESLSFLSLLPRNPAASFQKAVEQVPNAAVIIASGGVGGATGEVAGSTVLGSFLTKQFGVKAVPSLVKAGRSFGVFSGTFPIEGGATVLEEAADKGVDISNFGELSKIFDDPDFRKDSLEKALLKSTFLGGTQAVTSFFAGRRFAEARRAGVSRGLQARGFALDVAEQQLGEFTEETVGEIAKEKGDIEKFDLTGPLQEGMFAFFQSAGEVAIGGFDGSVRSDLDPDTNRAALQVKDKALKATKAVNDAQVMSEMGRIVREGKTSKRDADKIADVLNQEGESENPSKILFQVEDFDEYFSDQEISPSEMALEILGDEDIKFYNDAKETGQAFEIPLSKFVSKLADTEHFDNLIPISRTDVDGFNLLEANDFIQSLRPTLDEIASEVTEQTLESKLDRGAGLINRDIKSQLQRINVLESDAQAVADLASQFYRTQGERLGVDPVDLFNEVRPQFAREGVNLTQEKVQQIIGSAQETIQARETPPKALFQVPEGFKPTEGLAQVQQEAEGQFEGALRQTNAIEQYNALEDTKGGKVLSADIARQLSPDFVQGRDGQVVHTASTIKPATRFIQKMFDRRIRTKAKGSVAFTGGGPGSGKTFVVDSVFGETVDGSEFVVDGTLANIEKNRKNIRKALKSGRPVQVFFVYTPILESAQNALNRFQEEGRPVPPRPFTEDHINSIDSFIKIVEEFQGFDEFQFNILSNENRKISKLSLDRLRDLSYIKDAGSFDAALSQFLPQVEEIFSGQTQEIQEKLSQAEDAFQSRARQGEQGVRQPATQAGEESGREGEPSPITLFQNGFQTPFGFFEMDTKTVGLLKGASLETLLEEMAHLVTVDFVQFSSRKEASQEQKQDLSTLLDFLGVERADQLGREHWEKLAKSLEIYIAEGKAPTSGLTDTFRRMKDWIISAYRHLRNLNVEITDEVRAVFDRMLATDKEITEGLIESEIIKSTPTAESLGLTDKQKERFDDLSNEAIETAKEQLNSKLMKDFRRRPWRFLRSDEVKQLRTEINAEIDQRKEFIAASVLRTAKTPNGIPVKNVKLNRKDVIEAYGQDAVKGLPKSMFSPTGVTADFAASFFGFDDAEQFLGGLQFTTRRTAYVEALIDERLQKKHGDLLRDEALPEEALDAIHNDKRAQLLRARLEHVATNDINSLGKIIKRTTRRPSRSTKETKDAAKRIVLETKPRDLKPNLYLEAERRFARQSGEALARGDFEAMTSLTEQELLNFELFRESVRRKKEVEKRAVPYLKKFNNKAVRDRVALAQGGHLDNIDGLLETYEFKESTTLTEIDRRSDLRDYIDKQREAGEEPIVPKSVLVRANQINFKDVPIQELLDLETAVRSIEHQAKLKNNLLANKNIREVERFRAMAREQAGQFFNLNKEPTDLSPNLAGRIARRGKRFIGEHTKMEFLFRFLDGDKPNGFFHNNFFQEVADAEDAESEDNRDVVRNFNRIVIDRYSKAERAKWVLDTIYIPEIDDRSLKTPIKPHLTKAQIMAVALNMGNSYNIQALKDGYGWSQTHIDAILKNMDEKDWDFVEDTWDYINTFWPRVAKLMKEVTGVIPPKVEAEEFTTPSGRVVKGGYYPLVADSRIDQRTSKLDEVKEVKDLFGGQWARAMTQHGHTEERQNFGGKPVKLELSVIENHIANVVHDLNFRKVVIDLNKMIEDSDIKEIVDVAAGEEMYDQLKPWIRSIANDRKQDSPNTTERAFGKLRTNATIVYLGLKTTSAVLQTLGHLVTIKEIGPKYWAIGMRDSYANPAAINKTWQFITSRSVSMKNRPSNISREVRDAMRKAGFFGSDRGVVTASQVYTAGLSNAYFSLISGMDMFVSVPTWMGAYSKAMDGKVDNIKMGDEIAAIKFADSSVRRSQAAGAAKDLPAVQRGGEAWKLFTMFYSEASIKANYLIFSAENFKINRALSENVSQLVSTLALVWFLNSALEGLLRGDVPDPEDEPEEFKKWLVTDQFFYPFEQFVSIRDIASAADFQFNKGFSTTQGSPAFRAYESVKTVALVPFTLALTDDELKKKDLRASVELLGFGIGAPTGQMWKTGDYVYEYLNGNLPEKNPMEFFWESLVTGIPKDER